MNEPAPSLLPSSAPTLGQKIRNLLLRARMRLRSFDAAFDAIDAIVEPLIVIGLQHPAAIRAAILIRATKTVSGSLQMSLSDYFDSFTSIPEMPIVRPMIRRIMDDASLIGEEDGYIYKRLALRRGTLLLQLPSSSPKVINDIGIESGVGLEMLEDLAAAMWERSPNIVLTMLKSPDGNKLDITVDDAFHPRPSERATALSERILRFKRIGRSRAAILYGPPGTGKTSAVSWLAERHGTRRLRIPMQEVAECWVWINAVVNLFRPDVMIIDDIDRAVSTSGMLSQLDVLREKVDLFLVTANDIRQIDKAFLRPRRIDEKVRIRSQPDVVRAILGDLLTDQTRMLEDLPVVYAVEFKDRCDALGIEVALAELPDLVQRAKLADNDHDESTDESDEGIEGDALAYEIAHGPQFRPGDPQRRCASRGK